MRRLIQLILMAGFVALLTPSRGFALGDLHLGTFEGKWCNYPATFYVQRQDPDSWIFHGRVLIKSTQQYDQIRMEQRGDNSLYMVRYLTGDHAGKTQVVQTFSPEEFRYRDSGRLYFQFRSKIGYGGCESTDTVMYMNAD
jgi:hypothetical protein